MHEELQTALESLRRHASPLRPPGLSNDGAVVTGTAFFGADRVAIRELARLAGIEYSGDLINGRTTHLVLAPGCSNAASGCGSNCKLAKAAVWGIPIVNLAWLLDSIARQRLQPTAPYLLAAAAQQGTQPGVRPESQLPPSCHHLTGCHRPPSSTASNEFTAALGSGERRRQADSCQEQQPARLVESAQQPWQPAPPHRAALAPLHNKVLDQLQRMSLSPQAAPPQPAVQPTLAAWPGDCRPEQCSPAGSPQLSLSLQGLLADGGAQVAGRRSSCSPGEASSRDPLADEQLQNSPGALGTATLLPAGQPGNYSPMWESPLGEQRQLVTRTPASQQHAMAAAAAGVYDDSHHPFSFPTAAALQCGDLGDELSCSPMFESPAALPTTADSPCALPAVAFAAAGSAGHGGLSTVACGSESRPVAAPADVPDCSQACTLPTPACIRDWSDDDSDCGSLPSAAPAHVLSPGRAADGGSSQTPPALRRALEGGLSPTPIAASRSQVLQASQQQQQQQQQWQAADEEAECAQQTPAAARSHDWPDRSTEAAEPPSAADLVVADSDTDSDCSGEPALMPSLCQPAELQQAEQQQVQQQQQQAERQQEARPQPPPPLSQPRQLLQVSRPSTSRATAPGAASASQSRQSAASAAAEAPAAQVAACQAGAEEAETVSCLGEDEWSPLVTACGNSQQPLGTNVRDWSDDCSSGSDGDEELVVAAGHGRKAKRGGLTGLTQLDPASIVVARPKAAANAATGSGGAVAIKWLQRPSRGNAVRQHHGLANLKLVQFAEQVQVAVAGGLTLSTKDKKTAVQLQGGGVGCEPAGDDGDEEGMLGGGSSSAAAGQQQGEPLLGEPQCFYCLPDGTWWLEYCRLYTAAQAEAAAAADGRMLALPHAFDRENELLRAVERQHGPMCDVVGGVQVRRVKQGSAMLRLRGGTAGPSRSYFWRSSVDTASWRLVTDRPTADFVALH